MSGQITFVFRVFVQFIYSAEVPVAFFSPLSRDNDRKIYRANGVCTRRSLSLSLSPIVHNKYSGRIKWPQFLVKINRKL